VESTNALAEYVSDQLENLIKQQVQRAIKTVDIADFVSASVRQYFLSTGVDQTIVESTVAEQIRTAVDERLLATNLKWNNFKLSGDYIRGGEITDFGSTGIVDQASELELVIQDGQVVVENIALVRELEVVEDAVIKGNLVVDGSISGANDFAKNIQKQVEEYVDTRFLNLSFDEASEIRFGGKHVLTKNELGPSVINSNIRTLGLVKELEVSGETSLGDTLFITTTGKVGINTTEPDSALTLWDDEVKVNIKKVSKRVGHIGVANSQSLSLGIDDNSDILITQEQVRVNRLFKIGDRSIAYESNIPGYSEVTGSIRFNNIPASGKPLGWICLGGLSWAPFGNIQ